jgi:hypothetical protein
MNRRFFAIAGYLVAIAVGVGIGYLIGRNNSSERELAEIHPDSKPGEIGPDWKEWKYPGCAEHDFTKVGGGQSAGVKTPMHYDLVMTTKDDLEKVLGFYVEKTGISLLSSHTGEGAGGKNDDVWFVTSDSRSPSEVDQTATKDRPVRTKMFGKRTATYDLTMFVSRANDEKHTHIILSYDLKK